MNTVIVICSGCSQQVGVTPEALGKKVRCPLCQAVFEAVAVGKILGGSASTNDSDRFSPEQPSPLPPLPSAKRKPPILLRPGPSKTPLVLTLGLPVLGVLITIAVVLGVIVGRNQAPQKIALKEPAPVKGWERNDWNQRGDGRPIKEKFFILPKIDQGGLNNQKIPLSASDAVIKGRVIYDGDPPESKPIREILSHENKEGCLKGSEAEKIEQTWLVDKKTKGVANVVVWLTPPAGQYFSVAEEDQKRTDLVVIDQPHCAFVPHVVAVYPAYFDGQEMVKTGQKIRIKNSAPFPHNTRWLADGVDNVSRNILVPPNEFRDFDINPQLAPLQISCQLHTWMSGYIWIFDHPCHAVTNNKGEFEIRNVPVGVNLTFAAWHEAKSRFVEKKMSFKKGDNKLDLRIKK
jgi:hypothetical protein